jgi:hypothetical protein
MIRATRDFARDDQGSDGSIAAELITEIASGGWPRCSLRGPRARAGSSAGLVAIKRLYHRSLAAQPESVEMFLGEYRRADSSYHARCPSLEIGSSAGYHPVMEYIEGARSRRDRGTAAQSGSSAAQASRCG